MSDGQQKESTSFDPMQSFREMRDAYLNAMAKTMVDTVNTEAYAQASGAMLEGCLTAAAPFREAMEKSMTQALQQLSLPSRQEVAALAERFTHVEMLLDDMDARLDRIETLLRAERSEPGDPPDNRVKSRVTESPGEAMGAQGVASVKPQATRRRHIRPRSATTATRK